MFAILILFAMLQFTRCSIAEQPKKQEDDSAVVIEAECQISVETVTWGVWCKRSRAK